MISASDSTPPQLRRRGSAPPNLNAAPDLAHVGMANISQSSAQPLSAPATNPTSSALELHQAQAEPADNSDQAPQSALSQFFTATGVGATMQLGLSEYNAGFADSALIQGHVGAEAQLNAGTQVLTANMGHCAAVTLGAGSPVSLQSKYKTAVQHQIQDSTSGYTLAENFVYAEQSMALELNQCLFSKSKRRTGFAWALRNNTELDAGIKVHKRIAYYWTGSKAKLATVTTLLNAGQALGEAAGAALGANVLMPTTGAAFGGQIAGVASSVAVAAVIAPSRVVIDRNADFSKLEIPKLSLTGRQFINPNTCLETRFSLAPQIQAEPRLSVDLEEVIATPQVKKPFTHPPHPAETLKYPVTYEDVGLNADGTDYEVNSPPDAPVLSFGELTKKLCRHLPVAGFEVCEPFAGLPERPVPDDEQTALRCARPNFGAPTAGSHLRQRKYRPETG